jgi:hypothetical protein
MPDTILGQPSGVVLFVVGWAAFVIAVIYGARIVAMLRKIRIEDMKISDMPTAIFYSVLMISLVFLTYITTQRYQLVRTSDSAGHLVDGLTGRAWICYGLNCREVTWTEAQPTN